jgi:signal transduction histidine kinase
VTADRTFDDAQRMHLLADVAGTIAWAPDPRVALPRVAQLTVPRLGDWCVVDVLEGEATYRRLAVVHADARWRERVPALLGPWAPDPDRPGVARVVRTGQTQIAETSDAVALVPCDDAAGERLVADLGLGAYVSTPLRIDARPLGALTLVVADARRRFSDEDVALVETVARLAALTLAHACVVRELAEANRRQDDLLAVISHQLRTPLTAMLGWLQLARRLQTTEASRALDTIERNGRLLGRLIDDLIDAARILTGKIIVDQRPLNLAAVVRRAVESQRSAAHDKGVGLHTELPDTAPYAGDPARLEQVVVVLIANALKFTPAGGRVVARLDADARRTRIQVSDTGRGISPEVLPHVFERFRRDGLEPADPGLGLGLAIVRGLVTLHGGTIEAASAGAGRGATFTIHLPRQA